MTSQGVREDPVPFSGAASWLAGYGLQARLARDAWRAGGLASIRAGVHFDAIHLPAHMVEGGIRGIEDGPATERHFRAADITAAVIVSCKRSRYTVLVPADSACDWGEYDTEYVGEGRRATYVAVPSPVRREWPGAYWLLPAPEGPAMLNDPAGVRKLIGGRVREQTPGDTPVRRARRRRPGPSLSASWRAIRSAGTTTPVASAGPCTTSRHSMSTSLENRSALSPRQTPGAARGLRADT